MESVGVARTTTEVVPLLKSTDEPSLTMFPLTVKVDSVVSVFGATTTVNVYVATVDLSAAVTVTVTRLLPVCRLLAPSIVKVAFASVGIAATCTAVS